MAGRGSMSLWRTSHSSSAEDKDYRSSHPSELVVQRPEGGEEDGLSSKPVSEVSYEHSEQSQDADVENNMRSSYGDVATPTLVQNSSTYQAGHVDHQTSTVLLARLLKSGSDVQLNINPVTLRYREAVEEDEFLNSYNDVARMSVVALFGALIEMVWLIAGLVNPDYWETTVESAYARIPFMCISVLLYLCVKAFPDAVKQRYQATMLVYCVLAAVSTALVQMIDALNSDDAKLLSYASAMQYMLFLSMYCVYTGLLWRYSCVIQVVLVLSVIVLSPIDSDTISDVGFVVVMILVSLVVNLCASYSSEYYKRERFTKSQHVNHINQVVNSLLRDLLPKAIVDKVQETPDSQPTIWSFPKISVLFVSMTNLAAFADDGDPQDLFDKLNALLLDFDKEVERFGLYKVEYVEGDYVVTSPVVRDPSGSAASLEERCFANCRQVAANLVSLAFRLIELGQAQNLKLKAGISTGASVAGIIGQSRKFYRLFGDTVNTAARMKAYGEAGLVHMTDHTYELLKDDKEAKKLRFTQRVLEIKGKGTMTTYLAEKTKNLAGMSQEFQPVSLIQRNGVGEGCEEAGKWRPPHMQLRAWSKKFMIPEVEKAYSSTRLELRVTTMGVSAMVSAFSLVCYTFAVALFVPGLSLVQRVLAIPLIGIIFATTLLLLRYGALELVKRANSFVQHPSNKHLNFVTFFMSLCNFLCIIIVTAIRPGLSAYVSLQLWINIMATTGAGVGHATIALLAGMGAFFLLTIPFGLDIPVPWVLQMFALGIFVVFYCSFAQSRQRLLWYLSESMKHEINSARQLLGSMLPKFVIEEMAANNGESRPLRSESAVVLFSDISGFTKLSATLTPVQLVEIMDNIYRQFDSLVSDFELYKMDTIGDAYVVIGGLAGVKDYNVRNVVLRMLEVAHGMNQILADYRKTTGRDIQMRIGIHRGKAIAGTVGKNKPRFHIIGPAIDYANKLETDGVKSRIHVSKSIAADIFKHYTLAHRYDETEFEVSEHELLGESTFLIKGKRDSSRIHNRRASGVDWVLHSRKDRETSTHIDDGNARRIRQHKEYLHRILEDGSESVVVERMRSDESMTKKTPRSRRKRNLSGLRGLTGRSTEPMSPKTPKFADTPRLGRPTSIPSPSLRQTSVDLGSSQILSPTLASSYRRGHGSMGDLDALESLTRNQRMHASEDESVNTGERESSLAEVELPELAQSSGNLAWNSRVRDIGIANNKSGASSPISLSREPSQRIEDAEQDGAGTPTSSAIKSIFRHASKRDLIDANGYTVGMSMI